MSGDLQVTMVPKELYYHEVAYVRELEMRNSEIPAVIERNVVACAKVVAWVIAKHPEKLEAILAATRGSEIAMILGLDPNTLMKDSLAEAQRIYPNV